MGLELTYLTTDSLAEGVGASQVLRYVQRLAERDVDVHLHTFEKTAPSPALATLLAAHGVEWTPHDFGRPGSLGGVGRVARAAGAVRGADLVHARSDLAAAATMAAGARRWIWDIRSLWSDELLMTGRMRAGSVQERVMRRIERGAARRSSGIVTLSSAVLPVLRERHGSLVDKPTEVVPTCVDLDRFPLSGMPPTRPIRLVLSGTVNLVYDVPLMLELFRRVAARADTRMVVLAPGESPWDAALDAAGVERQRAAPDEVPAVISGCHVGLSVWRSDVGVALKAAMPTKVAELLATGRPVVVNTGLGDLDSIVSSGGCGVVVDASSRSLDAAADRLLELVEDPDTPMRCRQTAEQHFDLDRGVDALIALYEQVAG